MPGNKLRTVALIAARAVLDDLRVHIGIGRDQVEIVRQFGLGFQINTANANLANRGWLKRNGIVD
ncbi:hypothetical protein D3C78_1937130 [compost metagenome]